MNSKVMFLLACFVLSSGSAVWADQLILNDGREFSGKLVRADANVIEFRVQGKIQSFSISEVARINFKEPELSPPSRSRTERIQEPRPEPAAVDTPRVSSNRAGTPASSPQRTSATLPQGTQIVVRTVEQIDTEQNRVGESFEATLEQPLTQDGRTLAPQGTKVIGRIAYAQESGRISGRPQLILELTELVVNGQTYPLRTSDSVHVGGSQAKRTAAAAGGGAALGAIIGAIAGGGKGAAIGAAAGAGAGTGIQVLRGQTLKVPAETVLQFELQEPLTLDAGK